MNREPEIKRTLALFGFAFGSFALIAQGIMSVNNYLGEGMSFLGALVRYLSFLTILTGIARQFAPYRYAPVQYPEEDIFIN